VVTLRVYVACASAEWQRAEAVAARLEAAGCEITYRWWETHPVREGKTDADCTPAERRAAEAACTQGIAHAHVTLVLGSHHVSEGRAYELAAARYEGRDVAIVGSLPTVFGEPLDGERHHATDDAAIAYLADRVAGRWR
jgi:hypothetical protein